MSHAAVGQRSAQRPQWRQTSSSFTMIRFVCGSGAEAVDVLRHVRRRRREVLANIRTRLSLRNDREAVLGADVDARVALDAQIRREVRLHVAIETPLHFGGGLLGVESELDLDSETLEALGQILVLHLHALRGAVVVAVAPRVHADLRADEVHAVRRPLGERRALAMIVDRDRRLVSVLDGPDDVLRSPRRVAAEKDAGLGRHHRRAIHHGHAVLVELEADVALDPLERVLLADGEDDVVARQHDRLDRLHSSAFRSLPSSAERPSPSRRASRSRG